MNEYLTLQRVVELLEEFQKQSPILNSFGYGNLIDFSRTISASTVNYPYMFVVPLSINYSENLTEYQFSIIFADILNYDLSNELGAVSDMSLQAKRFMSYLKRGINTFPALYDNLDIILPTGAIPFMERFGDHTAGVALDCVIQVFEDLNACDFYPSPTPTAEPTNTPTMTPTNTITPTPTITPNAVCPQSLNVTSSNSGIIDVATYTRSTLLSGTTFDYGYLVRTGSLTGYFVSGTAPDGNNYPIFQFESGDTNVLFRRFNGSSDEGWFGVEQFPNPLISGVLSGGGGQASFGFNYTDIGGIRFIKAGTNTAIGVNIYVEYPLICPTPTPSAT
jgi:hypothetical protein